MFEEEKPYLNFNKKPKDFKNSDEWYYLPVLKSLNENIKKGYKSHTILFKEESYKTNDFWSCYAYGDTIKFVYFKRRGVPKKTKVETTPNADNEKRFSQSLSRTKSRIFELASCNEFQFFCTFTQDEKLRDRFDLKEFSKDLAQFVRNQNRGRENKIKYLLIPEPHKNGAWHMHGFLMGLTNEDLREFSLKEKLPNKMRNDIKNGVKIYDWTKYRRKFGFFTCTEIKDRDACAKYITKYVTKDLAVSSVNKNCHMFYASQGLKGRECIVFEERSPCPIDSWDYENDYIKIKEFNVQKIGL